MNIHLHEFFQIFMSNRVLSIKSFLIVRFSPCYLKGKNELSGASTRRFNWTLSTYGIFFIIFFEMTSNGRTTKKWILEIRNALIHRHTEIAPFTVVSIGTFCSFHFLLRKNVNTLHQTFLFLMNFGYHDLALTCPDLHVNKLGLERTQ